MNAYRIRRGDAAYGSPRRYRAALRLMRRYLKPAGGPYSIWTSSTLGWGPHRGIRRTMLHLGVKMFSADPGSRIRVMSQADNAGVIFTLKVVESVPRGTVDTSYGYIYPTTGPCKDDYPNIIEFISKAGQTVKLQEAAALSFQSAEREVGPIKLTGSWRSCATQTQLYAEDSKRYADPAVAGHPRAICIDVDTGVISHAIDTALTARGWHQSRPASESWHWSYWETR